MDDVSGFSLAYAYDLAGRLTQITHNTCILPQVTTYTLDDVGNRTSMQVNSQTPTTYQYDPLYRLESVSYPDGASTILPKWSRLASWRTAACTSLKG